MATTLWLCLSECSGKDAEDAKVTQSAQKKQQNCFGFFCVLCVLCVRFPLSVRQKEKPAKPAL